MRQRRHQRGFSLVEFVIALVIGSIISLPLGAFLVQISTTSNDTTRKLLASTRNLSASSLLTVELIEASNALVYRAGSATQLNGDEIRYEIRGVLRTLRFDTATRSLRINRNDGIGEIALWSGVDSFVVDHLAPDYIEMTIGCTDGSDNQFRTTVRSAVVLLNAR